MKKIIIAIDGPAGSGKTTSAKIVAEKLGYLYIDTGAMYRAVTYAWLQKNEEINENKICQLLNEILIKLEVSPLGQKTFLNGIEISNEIRLPEVTKLVSPVSAIKCVREKLVDMQRNMGSDRAAVLEGRDIGTVVFPHADLKIFLIATPEARANRRWKEQQIKGIEQTYEEILQQIQARDKYDSSREHSPLTKAIDAIEIDTTNINILEQTNKIIELANKIISL